VARRPGAEICVPLTGDPSAALVDTDVADASANGSGAVAGAAVFGVGRPVSVAAGPRSSLLAC